MLGQLGAIQRYYDGSEGASPSVFASSEALTSSRGLVVLRNTFSATLPSSDRLISERPCDGHADKRFFIRRRFFDEDLSRYTFSTVHLTAAPANVWAILFEVFLAVSHAVFYQGFDVTGFLSEDVARYFDNVDDGEKL